MVQQTRINIIEPLVTSDFNTPKYCLNRIQVRKLDKYMFGEIEKTICWLLFRLVRLIGPWVK